MRKIPLLVALSQLAVTGAAHAQSPPRAAPPSPAQRLRAQGSAEADAGRLPEALAAWRASWALSPENRSIACDIGRGELLLDHNVEAARWMHRCVRLTRDGGSPQGVERSRLEVTDLAVARSRVAEITLEVEDGAALLLNGESLGTAPLREPLFVEPGRQYRLEARKGVKVASATVDAVAGREHRVPLDVKDDPLRLPVPEPKKLTEVPRSPPPLVTPAALSHRSFVWWPAVAGSALTVTALGVGTGFWVADSMAQDNTAAIRARIVEDTHGRGCGGLAQHPECQPLEEAEGRQEAFATAAIGLFITSGIFAVATLGYLTYRQGQASVSITANGAVGRYVW